MKRKNKKTKTLAKVIQKGISPTKSAETKVIDQQAQRVEFAAQKVKLSKKEEKELKRIMPILTPIVASDEKSMKMLVNNANQQDSKISDETGWWSYVKQLVKGTKEFFIKIGTKLVSAVSWLLTRPEVWFVISLAFLALKRHLCAKLSEQTTVIDVVEDEPVPWIQVLVGLIGTALTGVSLSSLGLAALELSSITMTIIKTIVHSIVSFLLQLIQGFLYSLISDTKTAGYLGILVVLCVALLERCRNLPYVFRTFPAGTADVLTKNQMIKFEEAANAELQNATTKGWLTRKQILELKRKIKTPISAKSKVQKAIQNEWTKAKRQPIQKPLSAKFMKKGWFGLW